MSRIVKKKTLVDNQGITYEKLAGLLGYNDVYGVRVGGEVFSLQREVHTHRDVEYLTLQDREGVRIYERSLIFLMLLAARDALPGTRVVVEHSMGGGVYCSVRNLGHPFLKKDLEALLEKMRELAQKDLPFIRSRHTVKEAQDYFSRTGQEDKTQLLEWRPVDYFDMYDCDGMLQYFYGEMVPSTGYLTRFDAVLSYPGFQLLLPDPADSARCLQPLISPKLSAVFAQAESWSEILNVSRVSDINRKIRDGEIRSFIRVNEALQERSIASIADQVLHSGAKAVLIAGPSSSGKTTFLNRLCVQLTTLGMTPALISLDNYYKGRSMVPLDENGEKDYEDIRALDIELFQQNLRDLLEGKTAQIPVYDFRSGERKKETIPMHADIRHPVLIEGIHALNPVLSDFVDSADRFKIYLSALTVLNLDDQNRIHTSDSRLLRRMVRDYYTRGSSVEETLSMWEKVRQGEEKWIFPYQEDADVMFNSSLVYEVNVIRPILHPLLKEITHDSPFYAQSRALVKFLNYFTPIREIDEIPPTSILREFIGGNTFYVQDS
ncbi:MAG: nucleoside kinase [Clostridia bacterium]|nr:nucleoside kinase [Clostridia bacterium]